MGKFGQAEPPALRWANTAFFSSTPSLLIMHDIEFVGQDRQRCPINAPRISARPGEMERFDIIEHTADTGIIAYGASLEEALANAAYGMFTLIADPESVREETCRHIEVGAEDIESLLVAWLNELLYILDVERTLFKRFEVLQLTDTSLKAKAYGEPVEESRHRLRPGVKADTYHMLKIEKDDGYTVQLILDT